MHCEANPSFKLFDYGRDGVKIQYCASVDNSTTIIFFGFERPINKEVNTGFVGYDSDHDTAIVAHQGTNITHMYALQLD